MDRGTLYQLRNLINRRNVTAHPKCNVDATEDFFELVVDAYVVASVMSSLKMTTLQDCPDPSVISEDTWWQDDQVRAKVLNDVSRRVVDKHVNLDTVFKKKKEEETASTVYDYTSLVISLGLLYLDFKDAVREGDGERVLRIWKYFMLIWKVTGHKNYACEAFTLLSQYILLPPHLAEQLKWSRFVNTHGLPGHNISCDLHMEHLNRLVKTAMEGLGSNKKKKKAMLRTGKAVGMLATFSETFDEGAGVYKPSGRHAKKSWLQDLTKVVQELLKGDVFNEKTLKTHKSFPRVKRCMKLDEQQLKDWIINRLMSSI